MLEVTQLLKTRLGVRVICTQILRLPGCHCITLAEGFKSSGAHFFINKIRTTKPFWGFVRIADGVVKHLHSTWHQGEDQEMLVVTIIII